MAQITAENLQLGYEKSLLDEPLNFCVEEGSYLCIVGENGCGKSTLLKTLLGLNPVLSGQIHFAKEVQNGAVGYLPQQTALQRDFPASVREVVLSGFQAQCGLRPFYTRAQKAQAAAHIKRLGLEGVEKRCYRELSGGQQQRVLLARALCATKKLLILDEPVSGLDPKATADMYAMIESLNQKDGITIIMVSHDVQAALAYPTHILHLGETVFFGTREAYLESSIGRRFAAWKGGEGA
ncbi:MAG TPA: ABC transporter ATP-binding protein [Candidatus Ruthenibacterium merdavium]|uniref:ABC transporter ATP-binding protein n=1 Tax=Candidatus Ruthenibacterium merdavium TaxID=2838752 RepID=A0A9D2TJV2_9FIRM|nr:ABC transporter ATP-binding protein [Candidatus Ruthenibacterium merdavium]